MDQFPEVAALSAWNILSSCFSTAATSFCSFRFLTPSSTTVVFFTGSGVIVLHVGISSSGFVPISFFRSVLDLSRVGAQLRFGEQLARMVLSGHDAARVRAAACFGAASAAAAPPHRRQPGRSKAARPAPHAASSDPPPCLFSHLPRPLMHANILHHDLASQHTLHTLPLCCMDTV